ncbi:MAG: hypothetical protein NWE98_09245 [Candidatus Bathyarchaeota archaeon]|nr:hypothetical protein [Candidatus Bathyarchaeota archaeon]
MSLGEISGTIRMVNEASPTFEAISADAASMGENIRATSTGAQVSFNQVGVAATEMGVNVRSASSSFNTMQTHAEATTVSLTKVAGGIRETALMGSQLTSLAQDFGVIDSQSSKYIRTVLLMVQVVSSCARMYNFLTVMTTGQTAAVAVQGATETATAGAVAASGAALGVKSAITSVATGIQNALNISQATFLALTGVGIGVIIAAAAAMAYFASQMDKATDSVNAYNSAASQTPTQTKSIIRAGEQSLYRRGVE